MIDVTLIGLRLVELVQSGCKSCNLLNWVKMKRKFDSTKTLNAAQLITNRNNVNLEKNLRRLQSAPQYIHRLGLDAELVSHTGCVNCLEWSENGQ